VSEQVAFMPKMDYQTARDAAQCAKWFGYSGDTSFKEKAFRSLNFVTYCNDSTGKVFESPFSKGVNSWWSDSYGEGPSMFYHVLAAVPEWAPRGENHFLYSPGIATNIIYSDNRLSYTATDQTGTDYFRVSFKPVDVLLNDVKLQEGQNNVPGFTLKDLGSGNYALIVKRNKAGKVVIAGRIAR